MRVQPFLSPSISRYCCSPGFGPRTFFELACNCVFNDGCAAALGFNCKKEFNYLWKWKPLRQSKYEKHGLTWPPCYSPECKQYITMAGLTDREAEVNCFFDFIRSMEQCLQTDALLDLSQSITRASVVMSGLLQCVTPHSRLHWRRAKRWMIAPEAIRALGYNLKAAYAAFSHRQMLDLMGNSWNSSQCPQFVSQLQSTVIHCCQHLV